MSEPTVPVPVSLIERMRFAYSNHREDDRPDFVREMLALLAQPTPTAEPPSIDSMAPGTTVEVAHTWTVARDSSRGVTFLYREHGGYLQMMLGSDIDPSTIRDVTPPTTTREDAS